LLPQGVLFIPLAVTLSRLRLFGGMAALIIVYPTLVIPFETWVLWTSFHRLPSDLLDHARSDGRVRSACCGMCCCHSPGQP